MIRTIVACLHSRFVRVRIRRTRTAVILVDDVVMLAMIRSEGTFKARRCVDLGMLAGRAVKAGCVILGCILACMTRFARRRPGVVADCACSAGGA